MPFSDLPNAIGRLFYGISATLYFYVISMLMEKFFSFLFTRTMHSQEQSRLCEIIEGAREVSRLRDNEIFTIISIMP